MVVQELELSVIGAYCSRIDPIGEEIENEFSFG